MRTKASRHSHILVPDGLTARLMRTTRIRPWPIGTVWTPANLFPTGTEEGLFLDFSDISTLYTSEKFSTNISAIGDPVGGVIDKSQGGAVERTTDSNIGTPGSWTVFGESTVVAGAARVYSSAGAYSSVLPPLGATFLNRVVSLTYTITQAISGSLTIAGPELDIPSTVGTHTVKFFSSVVALTIKRKTGVTDITLSYIKAEELPGNHLIQSTSTARPIWTRHPKSGVRNLLDYSEDFSAPGEWVGVVATLTTGVADPLGGNTAIRVTPTGALGYIATSNTGASVSQVMMSAWLRSADGSPMTLHFRTAGAIGSAKSVTGTWQRFDELIAGTALDFRVQNRTDTRAFEIAFCQVEEGSSPTPYQTRVSKYNVTEAGVDDCYGLTFDGVDDYMVTAANLDLSGTDEAAVCIGTLLGDNSTGKVLFESAPTSSTAGSIGVFVPQTGGQTNTTFRFNTGSTVVAAASVTYESHAIITGYGKRNDTCLVRVNGVGGSNVATADTTDLTSQIAYLAMRSGSSLPFLGTIYGLTLTDYILDAEQLAALEEWTAARTPEVTLA